MWLPLYIARHHHSTGHRHWRALCDVISLLWVVSACCIFVWKLAEAYSDPNVDRGRGLVCNDGELNTKFAIYWRIHFKYIYIYTEKTIVHTLMAVLLYMLVVKIALTMSCLICSCIHHLYARDMHVKYQERRSCVRWGIHPCQLSTRQRVLWSFFWSWLTNAGGGSWKFYFLLWGVSETFFPYHMSKWY